MKAVVMERYGTPEVLELRDVATPTPKAGEVLVRVHAASVNDWDWGLPMCLKRSGSLALAITKARSSSA